MRRLLVVLALCAVVGTGCALEPPPGTRTIDHLWRVFTTAATPPPDGAPGWEPVVLPDLWGIGRRRTDVEAWYRALLVLEAAPAEPWAVYLPRIGQNVAVRVNGVPIGDGGPFTPPLPRNWNRPLLFRVPPVLLHAGDNVLHLRLVTHRGAPGYLRAFAVGPDRLLRARFQARTWWQVSLTQIVGAMALGGGALLVVFALRHGGVAPIVWIGVGLVLWGWSTADSFVHRPPLPTRLWEWSTAAALVWCPVAFALGLHRILGDPRPRVERALVLAAIALSTLLLAVPQLYFFSAMLVAVGGALAGATYVAALVLRATGRGERRRLVLLPALVALGVGAHDVTGALLGRTPLGVFLSPYLPAFAIAVTAWLLLARHLDSIRETEALNRELEHRVAEKHRELEANYERLRALERERAVAAERHRIMQDVHDGVGGQLVSALALVEDAGVPSDDVADVLREALDDLRLVIDSLDPLDCDLLAVLGAARARLEPRLQRHGVRVRWEVREVPPVAGFGAEPALQAMRIVQEAVTNVVKHAGARTITVRTGEASDASGRPGVFVEIADDGRGLAAGVRRGRGLSGMERRAVRLGGVLVARGGPGGTTVRLWMPSATG